MDAAERRNRIQELIGASGTPLTGGELASKLGVTRQVVVQDVAILRAGGFPIIATPAGYMVIEKLANARALRVFICRHETIEEAEAELMTIVENGGRVRDIIIEHPIYGEIVGSLMLSTPRAVKELIERLKRKDSQMLSSTTDGVHMHTVEAGGEETLALIEKKLREAGLLI